MLKKILILVFLSIVSSCGGGGNSSDNSNNTTNNDNSTLPIDYTNPVNYPVSATVVFSFHSTGDVFTLSDGSAWEITGTSNSGQNTGSVKTSNVTISLSTINTPDPVLGSRSSYYLIGTGITPAFFVIPLLITRTINDSVKFSFHLTGDVFALSDGSAWQITGKSSNKNTGSVRTSNVNIYPSTNAPDPVFGNRSDFYLIGDGINPAFFINPLFMTPLVTGTVTFSFHSIGDIFTLSDGSAWQITGKSSNKNTGSIKTINVIIYDSTNAPDPVSGSRSKFYLIGDGINPAFFITPI